MNGVGERAGNASLEEVVMGLRDLHGIETGVRMEHYLRLSELVARASGGSVSANKSLGAALAAHRDRSMP